MKAIKYRRVKAWKLTSLALALILAIAMFYVWRNAEISKAQELADSIVFDEFASWIHRHLNGNFSEAEKSLVTGKLLALRRRQLLENLIRTNPAAALEQAVPAEIADRLPISVRQNLEKHFSCECDYLVSVFDKADDSTGNITNHQIKREIIMSNSRYEAFVYGGKAEMTTKLKTPLRGIVLGGTAAIDENSAAEIKLSTPGKETAAEIGGRIHHFANQRASEAYIHDLKVWESKIAPARIYSKNSENLLSPWTEGNKSVLVIRVDFPDRTGEPTDQSGAPLTETRVRNVINNAVNPFYVANSYNKLSLQNPVVTPVVRMPQPQSFYNGFNLNTTMLADARNAARAAGFETNNYDLDIIAFSFTPNLSFSGSAIIGGKGLFLNGFFDFKTIAHELGHNFGLLHANLWRTTDGTVIGNGANVEYGDSFDLMGGGASQLTHFSAGYKRRLDWLTEANVRSVTTSGTYRVFAHDVISAPDGVQALKVRKDNLKDYWVEFRQLFASTPTLANGAFVRWDFAAQGLRQTQILDMTPVTTTLADAPLQIGQTFTDADAGITMTVLGRGNTTPESLDVRIEINRAAINGAAFDFDGDNKSDIGVFRPENGVWYLNQSAQGFRAVQWGFSTDRIVPAKFNLDRTTDIAVYRNGTWYVYNSFGGNPIIVQFGAVDDIPVPADYDGDGVAEMAVYRPSNGTWYLWNWILQRFSAVQFGIASDKPVPADYDGDGKTDVAVFRPETGVWYLLRSSAGFTAEQFGATEDKPVAADYDGDGKSDLAVFRPSNGVWYQLGSAAGFSAAQWGASTDLPAPADYDGDGRTDLAVYRGGVWYLLRSSQGFAATSLGVVNDKPLANAFVP